MVSLGWGEEQESPQREKLALLSLGGGEKSPMCEAIKGEAVHSELRG